MLKETYLNLCYLYNKKTPSVEITPDKKFRIDNNGIKMTEFTMIALIKELTSQLLDNR